MTHAACQVCGREVRLKRDGTLRAHHRVVDDQRRRCAGTGTEPPDDEETACRGCGCTDSCACPGGCWWVEPDLCSACVGPVEVTRCG